MAAGVMQYPRKKFFPALTAGRALRFFLDALLGGIYGQRMIDFFSRHYRPTMYALIPLAVVTGISALVYYKWYRPWAQRKEKARQASPPAGSKTSGEDQPTRLQDTSAAGEKTTSAAKTRQT